MTTTYHQLLEVVIDPAIALGYIIQSCQCVHQLPPAGPVLYILEALCFRFDVAAELLRSATTIMLKITRLYSR
jgi:hypothetical protein